MRIIIMKKIFITVMALSTLLLGAFGTVGATDVYIGTDKFGAQYYMETDNTKFGKGVDIRTSVKRVVNGQAVWNDWVNLLRNNGYIQVYNSYHMSNNDFYQGILQNIYNYYNM